MRATASPTSNPKPKPEPKPDPHSNPRTNFSPCVGGRDWPLAHARAIVEGKVGLTSMLAEHLSESATALFTKPKGRRPSTKQKTHLAYAATRQRYTPPCRAF